MEGVLERLGLQVTQKTQDYLVQVKVETYPYKTVDKLFK